MPLRLVATCALGLEELLAWELRALGMSGVEQQKGAVAFAGSWPEVLRANWRLRTANRVLVELGGWQAADGDALAAGAERLVEGRRSWDGVTAGELFDPQRSFALRATSSASEVRDRRWIALRVKDGLVDAQRRRFGRRASVERRDPDLQLRVWLHRDRAALLLDTSGDSLDHRGYRLDRGPAPLREHLAAACVLAAEWVDSAAAGAPSEGAGEEPEEPGWAADRPGGPDGGASENARAEYAAGDNGAAGARASENHGAAEEATGAAGAAEEAAGAGGAAEGAAAEGGAAEGAAGEGGAASRVWRGPVVDPMCGAGTLLAEAGAVALGLAPGRLRQRWAFERLPGFDRAAWERVRCEPIPAPGPDSRLYGVDSAPAALAAAGANLERAGLLARSELIGGDAYAWEPPPGPGVLLVNPAYGERLAEARDQWPRLGDLLKQRYTGWRAVVLAGGEGLGKHIGLRPRRRIPVRNGPLEARILIFDLY